MNLSLEFNVLMQNIYFFILIALFLRYKLKIKKYIVHRICISLQKTFKKNFLKTGKNLLIIS